MAATLRLHPGQERTLLPSLLSEVFVKAVDGVYRRRFQSARGSHGSDPQREATLLLSVSRLVFLFFLAKSLRAPSPTGKGVVGPPLDCRSRPIWPGGPRVRRGRVAFFLVSRLVPGVSWAFSMADRPGLSRLSGSVPGRRVRSAGFCSGF